MKRIAKRRLSCLLSAILLLVMSLDMSAFAGVFEKTARKIDVWDFGGVAESNTEMYQNNISASDWDNCSDVGTNAKFNAASIKFSVYAVVYEDKTKSLEITKPDNENTDNNVDKPSSSETVTPDDSQNTNAAPETGDSFGKDIMAASFAMIICAMGAAYVLMTRKRRQF